VILSGRHVNNSIAPFIANKVLKLMINKDHKIKSANVLILGVTFKENCPDIRNTKVIEIYRELCEFGALVDIYDPWAVAEEVKHEYDVDIINKLDATKKYEAIVLAVAHDEFKDLDFESYHNNGAVIFDAKAVVDRRWVDGRL
jgi:UDP-N-acetyl-D-galactosamine dehydrogenase